MNKITHTVVLFLFLAFTASANDYLDAINNESTGLSVDKATLSEDNKTIPPLSNAIPRQLTQTNFNTFLWENYYETWLRLNKLGYKIKNSIYMQYIKLSAPDINTIENLIKQEG